jgi:FtsP/CotA-like multicopper oxidase with cupredoxin domain
MHDVMHGVLGNFLIVNGMSKPFAEVPRGIVRFRILNGSNASIYRIYLSDDQPFQVIASDGGFLEKPVGLQELVLSAGERAEILVDFGDASADDKLRLMVDQYNGNTYEAMELRVSSDKAEQRTLVTELREQPRLAESDADRTRNFAMETMSGRGMGMMGGNRLSINGKKMDMNRIDEKIPLGSTEIWELENRSASMMQLPHSMHLHDVQFNILDRNGQPPIPIEAGRKDTVLLWPNDKVRLIARFLDYTGVYMYHCHMLEHEDDGMMGQFQVIDQGLRT